MCSFSCIRQVAATVRNHPSKPVICGFFPFSVPIENVPCCSNRPALTKVDVSARVPGFFRLWRALARVHSGSRYLSAFSIMLAPTLRAYFLWPPPQPPLEVC